MSGEITCPGQKEDDAGFVDPPVGQYAQLLRTIEEEDQVERKHVATLL
jgi:hypothetical protein